MQIGSVHLTHAVALAPMEEHTSFPFRCQAKKYGASLVCTERLDAIDVASRRSRTKKLLHTESQEKPRAAQISGRDPAVMAEAARVVEETGFDLVDLNFECPIRRLCGRGEGGALMSEPEVIGAIVEAVVRTVSIPVTLKIRSGPDAATETAVEISRRAEQAGASALIVHARSVAQAYLGGPDWSVVARVCAAVSIPALGSGGIREPADARRYLSESGAAGVAIGRGCLGNPWIFQQTRSLLQTGVIGRPPSPNERGRAALELVEAELHFYGKHLGMKRLPRTSCYFAKFLPSFDQFKAAIHQVRNLNEFRALVREHFR